MNICKHCGFTGEPEEFRRTKGKVCNECYKKQNYKSQEKYRKKNHKQLNMKSRNYYRNNRKKVLEKKRIDKEENREKSGILHWSQIKHLRLGLYVEKAIAGIFGCVTEPHNTPDIDFICPNGYKIQVKAASITQCHNNSTWRFNINRNKVVDYFILVAVNHIEDINNENFKPEHIWMMKGKLINKKARISVTPSRVSKWDKYSIMEEYEKKFISCCNTIKKNKLEY